MLPSGRSIVEQIFACDEGVMGFHNDRRTGGNMLANDRRDVICSILLITIRIYFKFSKRLRNYKITGCFVYLGRFSTCDENRLKLYDPGGNIYY